MEENYDLAGLSFFADLTRDQLQHVAAQAAVETIPRGTVLFMEGHESKRTFIIISGLVKVYKLHKEGREKTLAILGRGDILGEMTLYDNTSRSATAETMEESTLLLIGNDEFKQLLLDIPELAIKIIQVLAQRLRQADQHIQELLFLNARSRIICNLVHLAVVHGIEEKGRIKIPLRLTHAELANLVGVSRETATKVLDELQKTNLIRIKSKQLWIINTEELYRQGSMD